jgi:hypothetical protein
MLYHKDRYKNSGFSTVFSVAISFPPLFEFCEELNVKRELIFAL